MNVFFIIPICFDKNQQTKLCVFQSEYREYLVFFRQILHRHCSTDIISINENTELHKKAVLWTCPP
ncbi:hypothetical protein E1J06_20525 [Phocaeicola dorei]|uniref:Uncharacterized protein n=1 Tax=Phocaeicola dorei TaxID=357276 RepID=A0A4R4G915_9BACT|nr:hypothetical protein DWY81_18765 [Phocaeicola dorei]RGW11422.1 hypothetical protein DWV96_02635 [Phocaeicola vulgatus]RHI59265.1 hypothetical protein DW162_07240 [Phocaeicola vulgatus]TDA71597.1 hypothetical protein E1I98_22200 [Phocaeicola dorei]TDB03552.1 hypothetical protein E1J06_20525 [Phocaeicola dorei]